MLQFVDDQNEQLELLPLRKEQDYVSDEIVTKQSSFLAAINLSIAAAGLDPKQVYMEFNMDKAQWSRIQNGQAYFPHEKLYKLQNITGNDIPLRWWALKTGYQLKPIKSKLEQRIEELETENKDIRHENKILRELLKR